MRVSLNWLDELLGTGTLSQLPIDELVTKLDMTGTAVEAVTTTGVDLPGVVIGQIKSKVKHPDSDHLWLTHVDVGTEAAGEYADENGLLQIVCGAQNFAEGDKVPVATIGTVLDDEGKDFTIRKSKLRGIESFGMNCSSRELGLDDDHQGILVLPPDAPIGMAFSEWYGAGDTILDLEITPNRGDCLSMAGIAREVAAVLDVDPTGDLTPAIELKESDEPVEIFARVEVEDWTLCPRYTARVIRGVKIGPSPQWLADKVVAAGTRSINNIVDVTNFIMYELGQPLHAFDLHTIAKDDHARAHIIVRRANAGETMTTLDDIERKLDPSNLLITDPSGPIALAGVMGGLTTEVEEDTVDILLEAAVFDPETTSRTSRKLGLISEASLRFERGVDPNETLHAIERAAAMMAEVSGGTVAKGVIDVHTNIAQPQKLKLRGAFLTRIVGEEIPLAQAAHYLEMLGCAVKTEGDTLMVTVPTSRPDVTREIDLVEEVLRLWGMERISATLPGGRQRTGGLTREQNLRETINRTLRAAGLNETMTLPFSDPDDLDKLGFALPESVELVELHNPMSSEQAVLRPTLLPGLLESVSLNKRRGTKNVHLYEMGASYTTKQGRKLPREDEVLGIVLSGAWNRPGWNIEAQQLDFFDAKGVLEAIAQELNIDSLRMIEPDDGYLPWTQPGKAAVVMLGSDEIGWVGEIHPSVADKFEIDDAVVAAEIETAKLIKASRAIRDFVPPPKYPGVEMDIALVVDEDVEHKEVEQRIKSLGKKTPLSDAYLFDVYRGQGVPAGKKSMAYRLVYKAPDRTLTSEEVERAHEKLLAKLKKGLGAELRA